jgi:hypothetical protein
VKVCAEATEAARATVVAVRNLENILLKVVGDADVGMVMMCILVGFFGVLKR